MDYSLTFARHFARLVWLLSHDPANIDEQKAALRALLTLAQRGVRHPRRAGRPAHRERRRRFRWRSPACPTSSRGWRCSALRTIDVDRQRDRGRSSPRRPTARRHGAGAGVAARCHGPGGRRDGGAGDRRREAEPARARAARCPTSTSARCWTIPWRPRSSAPRRIAPCPPCLPCPSRRAGSAIAAECSTSSPRPERPPRPRPSCWPASTRETSAASLLELLEELTVRAEEGLRDDTPVRAIEICPASCGASATRTTWR